METVLGLINPWLKDGIKLVHCYLGLAVGCWCGWGMVVFFLCLLCVQSLLHPSVCTAVCFLWFSSDHLCFFWQSNHLWHRAGVPWASLLVSCPTSRLWCIASLFPLSHGSWVSITAQPVRPGLGSTACCLQSSWRHLWECSLLGEHPEGASRGKGPLDNPEYTLVCPTWSRFVQGQTPCSGQSVTLPTAALSQAYHAHCVASWQSLLSDSGQIKLPLCSWVLKARLTILIPAWDW